MSYTKPVVVAQNNKTGVFAAGCPAKNYCQGTTRIGASPKCAACQRAQ